METTNSIELKVVSFNCRGLSSLLEEIKTLCKTFDIILLQETWVAKQNLDFLNSINNQHYSYGVFFFRLYIYPPDSQESDGGANA